VSSWVSPGRLSNQRGGAHAGHRRLAADADVGVGLARDLGLAVAERHPRADAAEEDVDFPDPESGRHRLLILMPGGGGRTHYANAPEPCPAIRCMN